MCLRIFVADVAFHLYVLLYNKKLDFMYKFRLHTSCVFLAMLQLSIHFSCTSSRFKFGVLSLNTLRDTLPHIICVLGFRAVGGVWIIPYHISELEHMCDILYVSCVCVTKLPCKGFTQVGPSVCVCVCLFLLDDDT